MDRAQFIQSLFLAAGSAVTGTAYAMIAADGRKGIGLLECPVAGHQFYMHDIPGSVLMSGMPVLLKREPSNTYDSNAIAVYALTHKTGYIPREHNTILASLLDQGMTIEASLVEYDRAAEPWERMWISICLHL